MPTEPKLVSITEPVVADLHKRIGRVEDGMAQARLESAQRDTQIALMKASVDQIRTGQDKITSGINRILWAVGLSVLGAATTFVLSGGFVIIQQ